MLQGLWRVRQAAVLELLFLDQGADVVQLCEEFGGLLGLSVRF